MTNYIKQSVEAIHRAFSENRLSDILPLCQDDVTVHAHSLGMTFHGKDGFMGFMQAFKTAFPDVSITHENIIVDGNKAGIQFSATATHTGTLSTHMGDFPATGKRVNLSVAEFMYWEGGKLKSLHNYQDAGNLLRQITV